MIVPVLLVPIKLTVWLWAHGLVLAETARRAFS